MQRLFPVGEHDRGQVDPATFRDWMAAEHAWVAVGMVASVDGAAALDGRSGRLGGEGDRLSFRALRAVCDVILVGAGTARAEGYGPVRLTEEVRDRRLKRGQSAMPIVAIVSRSLQVEGLERLLPGGDASVAVSGGADGDVASVLAVTSSRAPQAAVARMRQHGAEVILAGEGAVDLREVVESLRARGLSRILCEGGPSLNADMMRAGVIDHVFTTVAPAMVGGSSPRIVSGMAGQAIQLDLVDVHVHGADLLLHHRVIARS